ncbi:hypothetical protein BpHYR1_023640 [Brachionus plicatilis]|uniref:Uncharacterized protein n=1 Tax=Brachionus plicatilis TaxID=10195 RepID=A0A3M7RU01_BRAPC|nr:hypothetical protein BpHYR1_023640 [Brachionus plicatilis]
MTCNIDHKKSNVQFILHCSISNNMSLKQSEFYCTLSCVAPSLHQLKNHMIEVNTFVKTSRAFVKDLEIALEQRFEGIFSTVNGKNACGNLQIVHGLLQVFLIRNSNLIGSKQ